LTGTTVFIFNAPRYALGLPFVPGARDDDGWLDLLIFRDPGPFKALYYLWKVFCGTHLKMPGVFHRRVKKAFVTAEADVPIQIDGDPGGLLLAGGDSASPPACSSRGENGHQSDQPAGGGLAPISAAVWKVEIIPQALDVFAPPRRRSKSHRAPLAGEDVAR
jgi:diacylglycerol kinase family enzyme